MDVHSGRVIGSFRSSHASWVRQIGLLLRFTFFMAVMLSQLVGSVPGLDNGRSLITRAV